MRQAAILAGLVAVGLSSPASRPAHANEQVSCSNTATGKTCRITEPNVTRRLSTYPQITFSPGDRVTVQAGGCVQTGGTGRTWKRYVNPSGSNSDRLYHGLIQIPGVHSDLVRTAGVVGRPVVVPPTVNPQNAFLRLGYEDDNYSDNGYWGHDDGTEDQCRGVGNAFVVLTIDRGPPPPPPSAPFDLVWTATDASGLPLNPQWAWQREHPGSLPNADTQCFPLPGIFSNPKCTTQSPSIDNPTGWNAVWCAAGAQHSIHGHVNWMPAIWQGKVFWESHSAPGTDDDYNINVVPPSGEGLTVSSEGHIHSEFDSDETIDHFRTPWWNSFHAAVDRDDASARAMIDGKFGIVVGLAGLDCEHGCATELHPVYALTIHVNDNPQDDTWAIFVRNWGDEGYCSQDQHFLDANRIAFFIPQAGATAVQLNAASTFLTNSNETAGPLVSLIPGQGARVEFQLPDPGKQARINGELHLRWTTSGAVRPPVPSVTVAANQPEVERAAAAHPEPEEVEKRIAEVEKQLSPEARQAMAAKVRPTSSFDELTPKPLPPSSAVARLAHPPAVRAAADPRKAQRDQERAKAMCAAFGGNVPGMPNACASVQH